MRAPTLLTLLLAGIVNGQDNVQYTVLDRRTLPSGRELQSIQEHVDDLPELPTEADEEVMVPVDDNGKVLPGYEVLLQPKVVYISRADLERLNNSRPVAALERVEDIKITEKQDPIEPYPPNDSIASNNNQIQDTVGSDYDEAVVPDSILPTVKDYVDSKEKDVDVEIGDDGLKEEELEKLEKEIVEEKENEQNQMDKLEEKEVREDMTAIMENAKEEEKKTDEEVGLDEFIEDIGEKTTTVSDPPILLAGQNQKPEGYVLDTSSLEEPEEQAEEDRKPSRLHRGEVIGTRRRPDSSRKQSIGLTLVFCSLLFF